MKFEAEGQEFAKFLRSLEQFIPTVKDQNILTQNAFLITIINELIPEVLHSAHVYPLDPEYVSAILNA